MDWIWIVLGVVGMTILVVIGLTFLILVFAAMEQVKEDRKPTDQKWRR